MPGEDRLSPRGKRGTHRPAADGRDAVGHASHLLPRQLLALAATRLDHTSVDDHIRPQPLLAGRRHRQAVDADCPPAAAAPGYVRGRAAISPTRAPRLAAGDWGRRHAGALIDTVKQEPAERLCA